MENIKREKQPPKYPEIGARLTQFIEESGEPNARQFALKAGLTPQLVSHLAGGYSIPGGETLVALTTAYRAFDSDWLLTGRTKAAHPTILPGDKELAQANEPTPGLTVGPLGLSHSVKRMTDAEQAAYWRAKFEQLEQEVTRASTREDRLLAMLGKTEASAEAASLYDDVDTIASEYLYDRQARDYRIAAQANEGRMVGQWIPLSVA